jgi:hypothetical protein
MQGEAAVKVELSEDNFRILLQNHITETQNSVFGSGSLWSIFHKPHYTPILLFDFTS